MTEFALIQIADRHVDTAMANSSNLLTILFAYVVVAFLVGKELARAVAATLSIVYSLAMVGEFLIQANEVHELNIVAQQYHLQFPEGVFTDSSRAGF